MADGWDVWAELGPDRPSSGGDGFRSLFKHALNQDSSLTHRRQHHPVPDTPLPISDRVLRYDWSKKMVAHSASQRYLSTRGGSYDVRWTITPPSST